MAVTPGQLLAARAPVAHVDVHAAGPGWEALSGLYTDLADVLTGRVDLTVVAAPLAADGVPGRFVPSMLRIDVDGDLLPLAPDALDLGVKTHWRALAALHGVFIHELGHAEHTRWIPRRVPAPVADAMALLEEIRMESRVVADRPASAMWLRAAATTLICDGITEVPDSLWGAAHLATLTCGRVIAGSLLQSDVAPIVAALDAALGAPRRATLMGLWEDTIGVGDEDYDALAALAVAMLELCEVASPVLGIRPATTGETSDGATSGGETSDGEPGADADAGSAPGATSKPDNDGVEPGAGAGVSENGSPEAEEPSAGAGGDSGTSGAPGTGRAPGPVGAAGAGEAPVGGGRGSGVGEAGGGGGSGTGSSDLAVAVASMAASIAVAGSTAAAGSLDGETLRQELSARVEEVVVRTEVVPEDFVGLFGGLAAGVPSDGVVRWKLRLPTPAEKIQRRKLASKLQRVRFRNRQVTSVPSTLPPGRLRPRAALVGSAERSLGKMVTAQPWRATKRTWVESPRLRVGILCDTSGSMWERSAAMSSATWVLASAVADVGGRSVGVAFGDVAAQVFAPGDPPTKVLDFLAVSNSEAIVKALRLADAALNFGGDPFGGGAGPQVLVVISDGVWTDANEEGEANALMASMRADGVKIIQVSFAEEPYPHPSDARVAVAGPTELVTLLGEAFVAALRHA